MDNDAAHHANIALRMYQTGDYVNLIDQGKDYLDKPHLHFWLCTVSFKIFGPCSFAYKLPSFLISIGGVYSVFRLASLLYNKEAGRLAALIFSSAFAFLLSLSDVRMDALLTSFIAFSSWQLIAFIQTKKIAAALLSALGLALGFCTKGHIAVFVPGVAALFYLLYKKETRFLLNWKWLLVLFGFLLMISPVLYCYYLQFNLHPEKLVRGRDHINGLRFILFDQVIDRFTGKMEAESNHDHFFFLHSYIPAFAPWAVLAYLAIFFRLENVRKRTEEWSSLAVFISILLVVSASGYQMPHYLNVVFPSAAIMVATFILSRQSNGNWVQVIFMIQMVLVFLLLVAAAVINAWAFPVQHTGIVIGLILLLAVVFYFIKSKMYNTLQRSVAIPAATMIFIFFLLNTNFYPQLLKFQAGNELAKAIKGKIDPARIYFWENTYSSSFNFFTRTLRQEFNDSTLLNSTPAWLIYDIKDTTTIKSKGYELGSESYSAIDFEITMLDLKFLNPDKREDHCTRMLISPIVKSRN